MNDGERAELAKFVLEQRRSLLESVSNNIDAGLVIIDRNYRIVWANEVLRKVGACPGELCYESIPHAKAVCQDCGVKKIFSQNVPLDVHEYKTVNHRGETVWIELRVTPLKDACGNITSALELAVPITERKKAEEKVIKSQAELQAIFEASPDSTFLLGQDYRFTRINRLSFEPGLKEVLIGKDSRDYLAPQYRSLATQKIDECFATCRKQEFEHQMSNGRYVVSRIVPVRSESSNRQVLVTTTDITERILLQEQVQEKERLAAIGATAGMVGHDIRNPLQSITGELYLLNGSLADLPDSNLKNEMKESLDSITSNIFYINKIVADLQDYARPISPEYSLINFSDLLLRIFETIRLPESIKLSIKVNNLEKIRADPTLLQRALSNIVTNAIQAMPNGGNLEITSCQQKNKTLLMVSDTGIGIPDKIKPKLFTPMMTTKSKGQGFGLAVSKRLIEAMKGKIRFESEQGKGTRFIIELPNTQ